MQGEGVEADELHERRVLHLSQTLESDRPPAGLTLDGIRGTWVVADG